VSAPSIRRQLEDRVIELLADMKGGLVVAVEPYNGQLANVDNEEEVLTALMGMMPGVLVTTAGASLKNANAARRRMRRDIEVHIWLAVNDPRSREDRTRDVGGIYELLDAVHERLIGATVPLQTEETIVSQKPGAGVLEPITEDVVAHSPSVCLWMVKYRVTVDQHMRRVPATEITEVRGRLNLPTDEDNAADPIVTATTTVA